MEKKKRSVSRAPAPISSVRGNYLINSQPTHLPEVEWLKRFPAKLLPRIESVLGNAAKEFKIQENVFPFLEQVIKQLTPDFCEMSADYPMFIRMSDLVNQLLIDNTRDPWERRRRSDEIRTSPEWTALTTKAVAVGKAAKRSASVASELSPTQPPQSEAPASVLSFEQIAKEAPESIHV